MCARAREVIDRQNSRFPLPSGTRKASAACSPSTSTRTASTPSVWRMAIILRRATRRPPAAVRQSSMPACSSVIKS